METGILAQALAISPINLQVDLSTDILRVGDELIVHVSATNAYSTMLETDENTKQYGDAVYTYHVVFHRNKIRRAWIKVTAYGVGIPRTTSQTVYVRLRFYIGSFPQEAQQTYNNSLDYARGYDMSNNRFYDLKGGWDVMWEFMKFGARYNQTIHDDLYSGEGLTPELAIEALLLWSKEYFTYFYQYGITVSYTGYETAQDFQGFDGEHDTYETFDPGRRYECSSMAAFISSIGLIMGLPARMVSLSDFSTDQLQEVYQHLFAEIYGYSINGNNGWFLIDPARDSNVILSSYDNISEVKEWYAHADGQVKRLWIIWGIDSTGWGENVYGRDRQTSWVGYGDEDRYQLAPNNEAYVPNPWDIVVMDLP